MRKVFLVMAACFVLASPAFAGGGVDLYGAYGEVVDGDAELGLGLRLSIGGSHWMFDIGVTAFLEAEDVNIGPANEDSLKYRAYDLGLRYQFYEGHKVRPYVGAGMTYAQVNAIDTRVDSGLGVYGLGGIRFGKPHGINFMAELIYRWTEVQARYDLINEKDVSVGGLALQAGISFAF